MQNLTDILKLAEIQAEPMGLLVVDARLYQQGKRRVLEVSICRKGGRISLSDCEELSRKLDKALDEQAPPLIEGSYMLEVQSPGLDRQLKTEREFAIFSGETVEVRSKESIPALGDTFTGKLQSMTGGVLRIDGPRPVQIKHRKTGKAKTSNPELPENVCLDWSKVAQVRLHPSEPDTARPSPDESEKELSI